jgi:NAD(P)-dependent dehydrogenase (short-subunit alcohol dehydrogenase family)
LPALLLGATALGLIALARTLAPPYSFRGKVVLITGGSRGLGLVMARQLAAEGARVALMARHEPELARAAATVSPRDHVLIVRGDVREPADCARVVATTVARFHRLDVLVNNAGIIVSAPVGCTSVDDLRAAMDVHYWGMIHMTSAALPHLLVRPDARLVNICSIGAKVAVPHLAAYCASKFAQAGLSAVLAEELRGRGVTVSTVYPGLMRTGSHLNARFRGDLRKEFAVFALASGLPGVSMGAERAARLILAGVRRGQAEVVVPFTVRQIARLAALAPNAVSTLLGLVSRTLPDGSEEQAGDAFAPTRGAELRLPGPVRSAIVLSERAATRNNERSAPLLPY